MVATPPTPPVTPARRSPRRSRRRVVLVAAGVLVLILAVVGYLFTSGFFDEDEGPTGVLVTAVDISPGSLVSSADFSRADIDLGGLPHVPWSEDAPFYYDGLVALGPIPAGLPVVDSMFRDHQSAPLDDQLEVVLELDLTTSPSEVLQGDTVLLVDPGTEPSAEDDGRPPSVIRPLLLDNFDGEAARLFVPPEEWAFWQALPEALEGAPQVLAVPLGGDADDMAMRLNEVWAAEYDIKLAGVQALQDAVAAALAEPEPGPGELELTLTLDLSLAPAPPEQGDTVLLVDPGEPPTVEFPGRPRSVLDPLELTLFDGNAVTLFLPPDEWHTWSRVPEELGAAPLVLPVAPGSDVTELAEALDRLWLETHEADLAALAETARQLQGAQPAAGQLAVDVPLDISLSPQPVAQGDLVLLIDPGVTPTADDPGRPRRVLQPIELTNFDGIWMRLFVPPAEWLRWSALSLELGADPQVLPVPEGSDVEAMTAELNAAWSVAHEAALAELGPPPEGQFWVSLPVTLAASALNASEGDVVFLVDPGRPAEIDEEGNVTSARIPPNVLEWRPLEGWNGGSLNFWASADRYAYYTFLSERLQGRVPLALPLVVGDLSDSQLDSLLNRLNSAFDTWSP